MKVATVLTLTIICIAVVRGRDTEAKKQYLKWLKTAGFYTGSYKGIERMDRHTLDSALRTPLRLMKRRYRLGDDDFLDFKTESLLKEPRCGNKDTDMEGGRKKRFTKLGNRVWKDFPVTVRFKNYLSGFSRTDLEDVAMGCCRKWARVSGLSFKLTHASTADIEISFESLPNDQGAGGVIGFAQSPNPGGSSFLKIDSRETWKLRQSSPGRGISMEEALCHEMGHNLALGHSNDRNAIMFATVGFRTVNTQLGDDDIRGIRELYGPSNGLEIITDGGSQTESPVETTTERTTTRRPIDTTTRPPIDTTTRPPIDTTTRPPVVTTTRSPVRTTQISSNPCDKYRYSWYRYRRCLYFYFG